MVLNLNVVKVFHPIAELFKKGKMNNRYRVLLGMGGQLIQQFGGINVISYYLTDVFMQAGMTKRNGHVDGWCGCYRLLYWCCYPLSLPLNVWVVVSSCMLVWIGQAVTLLIVGGAQYIVQTDPDNKAASNTVIAFVMLYNFVFGAAWLGLAWLYPSEIFSTGLRAKGNSMSTAANWLGNFVVAMIAPVLFEYAKYWTFLLFGILNVIFLIPIYLYYPETMGKSLEEIEVLFASEEIQEDAKSTASHIGSTAAYDKNTDTQSALERASRPQSRRFPSNFSRNSGMIAPVYNEKPAVDTAAADVKHNYDVKHEKVEGDSSSSEERGPNYK